MLCLDEEDLTLNGDFNSATALMMNIQLIKCTGREDCKSDAEILKFFRGRYIMLMYNQIRFNKDEFGEERITKESRIAWLKINTQVRQTLGFKVLTTQLELQDEIANFDDLTE